MSVTWAGGQLDWLLVFNMDMNVFSITNINEDIEEIPQSQRSGPEVIKFFSCSTRLSMKFSLLINMKMPTIVGIFIFISREIFMIRYV